MGHQFGVERWFPDVSDDVNSGPKLYFAPRYTIPQMLGTGSVVASPCIFRGSLPEWAIQDAGGNPPFAAELITRRLTPHLVWVEVTPRVRAWVLNVVCRTGVPISGPWSRMRSFCTQLVESYCRQRFTEEELSTELASVEKWLADGGSPAAVLPRLDEQFHWFVRHGFWEPWDGYEQWSRQFSDAPPPPDPDPPKSRSTPSAARSRPRVPARSGHPELF